MLLALALSAANPAHAAPSSDPPKPTATPESRPDTKPAPEADPEPAAKPEAKPVDWRGLDRLGPDGKRVKRDKPPPNPVQQLVQNAPYRVHVATTDGTAVKITDAYTLERRRVFSAPGVVGLAFSSDGHWLYVAHGAGRAVVVSAVAVRSAKARRLATLTLGKGEALAELRGHGKADAPGFTALLGRGKPWRPDAPCSRWRGLRAVRWRTVRGALKSDAPSDLSVLRFPTRTRQVSPNTRYTVELDGGLKIHGRFGGGNKVSRLDKGALPRGSFALRWARDSRGVFVVQRRARRDGCAHLKGIAGFRQPASQYASWKTQRHWPRWVAPGDVQLVRGDLGHQDLSWSPDGMRMVGVTAAGVVLVEPTPRGEAHVVQIAPPSAAWPAVRPGVRSLAMGKGALRHAEILLEQGQLDAAAKRLAGGEAGPEKARLAARLEKLRRVRARRAAEFAAKAPGAAATPGDAPPKAPAGAAPPPTPPTGG